MSSFAPPAASTPALQALREATGEPLPRILLVFDEFHVLFARNDKLGLAAAELLETIIRQGRGFGIHVLLGSQSLSGLDALGPRPRSSSRSASCCRRPSRTPARSSARATTQASTSRATARASSTRPVGASRRTSASTAPCLDEAGPARDVLGGSAS